MIRNYLTRLLQGTLALVLTSVLVLGSARQASAGAGIYYVKASATGLNNGTSWKNAFKSLQSALGTASSGDQIWVAKGTYKPGSTRSSTFVLINGVAIYGGFAGTESHLSQRNPAVNVTILSGEIGGAGISDNSFHVLEGTGTDSTAVLDGFTIQAGNANNASYPYSYGAGMYSDFGSPTLSNLIFSGNTATDAGGGMYNIGASDPTLTNVTFTGNKARFGAGMENEGSSPELLNVSFLSNIASFSGGGIFNDSSSPSLINVEFSGNQATHTGGGMDNASSSGPVMIDATFNGNSAYAGGGMYNESASAPVVMNATFTVNTASYGAGMENDSSHPTLRNVTFSNNTASVSAGGMYNQTSSTPLVYDTILWGDGSEMVNVSSSAPTVTDSIVQGGCPGGASCTNVHNSNPKLGPLQNNGGLTMTRALGAGSAAIDLGGLVSACVSVDQRGVSRPQGVRCDIGAYEVSVKTFSSQAAKDGWLLESSENSNVGGTMDHSSVVVAVGDDASNKQYRGVVSFNTAPLPDGAAVVMSKLQVKEAGVFGTYPFGPLGHMVIDLAKPFFGSSANLQFSDFQAVATKTPVGTIPGMALAGWHSGLLNSVGRLAINKTGTTQFRLRFSTDDNNNHVGDFVEFFTGEALSVNRPVLVVYYNP